MPDKSGIFIGGGYGAVGRRMAARLAPLYPDRVIVSGRNVTTATQLSSDLGYGVRARHIDVDNRTSVNNALDGVGMVVSCVQQREQHLLRAAIGYGLAYTDISRRLPFWRGIEGMNADARRTGARVLLGAGLSPGISNVMARQLVEKCQTADEIEMSILLGIGDEFGPEGGGPCRGPRAKAPTWRHP